MTTPALRRNLCLFDLDHTLLPLDSDHAFGTFLVRIGWVDGDEFRQRNEVFYRQYQAEALDIDAYIEHATRPWRDRPLAEVLAMRERFMAELIAPKVLPAALDLVAAHQRAGDLVAIVTATNEFVTTPIAEAFGVPHLIAVELERDASGTIDGRIRGVPSYREGKVVRVEQWLRGLGHDWSDFERSSFYSDSMNDVPLLEHCTDPVATNPAPALESLAVQRGWRILTLFHDQDSD